MAVIKVYNRINWLNKSESLTTPLGKTNLNKMDKAIDTIDNEVVSISANVNAIDTTKADKTQLNNMVTDISFNDKNGVISITKYNGTVLNIDTAMEKIAVNFEYNAQTQQLILTLENGEKQYIDMSALITQYEFKGTDTIAFSIDSDGKVNASIKSGSITKAMLSSEVMSAITLSESNAVASAQAASQSATNADMDAKLSQSYSVGKSGIRDGEDTDNSKYYSEQAKKYADEAQEIAGGNFIPNSEKGVANGVAVLNANLAVEKAVADEDGNNIQATYVKKTEISEAIEVDSELSTTSMNPVQNKVITKALQEKAGTNDIDALNKNITQLQDSKADKTEVPKLVKVDGTTVFLSEDGVLSAKGGGGTSIAPKAVSNVSIKNGNGKVSITWTDPDDVTLEGITLSTWAGTKLVMNESDYPTNENDGTVVFDSTTRNQYQNTSYEVTGLTNNKIYYFALFPYSTDGIYNYSETGRLLGKPSLIKLDPCTDMKATATMGKVTVTWTDPNATKTENGNTATWQKTVLIYKQGTTAPTDINDGTIAVEETTRNQYQSTGYEVTSLIDGNDYSFSLFAISTDSAVSDATSVFSKLYATLTVTTEEIKLYGKAVTVTSDSQEVTGTFNDSGSVTLKIPWIGSTVVSSTDGTDTATVAVNIAEYGKSYNAELSFLKIVTFADGTDEEIAAMINAHYNNKINIQDYWAVGDVREIGLSAMSATYVGESHLSGTYKFAIADFDHDDLTTSINGHTKAAVTLTQVDCLMDIDNRNNPVYGIRNAENGYMNSTNTNAGGWKECARRKWCNNIYYNAIIGIKDIVKEVNKKASAGSGSSTIVTTTDKVFLLSEIEIYGSIKYSVAGEGSQYQYYKNAVANRYKTPKWASDWVSNEWWQRSCYPGDESTYFCIVERSGQAATSYPYYNDGIAPCFCI